MESLSALLDILDLLLGPNGCPWDREQTLLSMRPKLVEEVHELIEAVDHQDKEQIREELGDLLFNAIFLCKLAEKEGYTTFLQVVEELKDKLIRRHPHIFGDAQASNSEAVLEQWEQIKKGEKGKEKRTSTLDGIPKGLPALSRAQRILSKLRKQNADACLDLTQESKNDEITFGKAILKLVGEADARKIDLEQALQTTLSLIEKKFRAREDGLTGRN